MTWRARARSRAGLTKRSGGVWYLFEASRSSIWTEVDNTQVALMASRWTSHFCVAVELAHRERLLKRGDHHG